MILKYYFAFLLQIEIGTDKMKEEYVRQLRNVYQEWNELYSFNNATHAALATLQLVAVHKALKYSA